MQVETGKAYLTGDGYAVFLCYRVKSKKEVNRTLTYQRHIYVGVLIGVNIRAEIGYDYEATYTKEGMFCECPSALDLQTEASLEDISEAMHEYIKNYGHLSGNSELELFYKEWTDK